MISAKPLLCSPSQLEVFSTIWSVPKFQCCGSGSGSRSDPKLLHERIWIRNFGSGSEISTVVSDPQHCLGSFWSIGGSTFLKKWEVGSGSLTFSNISQIPNFPEIGAGFGSEINSFGSTTTLQNSMIANKQSVPKFVDRNYITCKCHDSVTKSQDRRIFLLLCPFIQYRNS